MLNNSGGIALVLTSDESAKRSPAWEEGRMREGYS